MMSTVISRVSSTPDSIYRVGIVLSALHKLTHLILQIIFGGVYYEYIKYSVPWGRGEN